MYGLVNKAVRDFIEVNHGVEAWADVRRKADIRVEEFVSLSPYDDALTYALVGAAAERLKVSAEAFLEGLGVHWTAYAAEHGYGQLLDVAGNTFVAFLQGLDDLHTRVALQMPQLRPPGFECSEITENSVLLHYRSERAGLAPFVVGLIKGLGDRFGLSVTLEHRTKSTAPTEPDVFFVRFEPESGPA